MEYTISIQKNKNGWLTGQCEQLPEAISEGSDMDHLMKNMREVIKEALEIRKEEFLEARKGERFTRRILYLPNEKNGITKSSKRKQVFA